MRSIISQAATTSSLEEQARGARYLSRRSHSERSLCVRREIAAIPWRFEFGSVWFCSRSWKASWVTRAVSVYCSECAAMRCYAACER